MRAASLLAIAALLVSTSAHAQVSQADALAAESLFREAKDLVSSGKPAEACPKFAESQRLDPQIGTMLHLATCHSQEGKTATAWSEFLSAADMAARAKDDAREKIARERADKLSPTVPRLLLQIDPANPALDITLDGQKMRASAGVPVPVDPGVHTVEASAASRTPWSQKVTLPSEGGTQTVRVPLLQALATVTKPEAPAPSSGTPTLRYVGYGSAALGVIALGVGTGFGLKSLADKSTSDEACNAGGCTQAGLASYDDARSAALICDVAVGVGVVALAAGIVLILTSSSSSSSTPPAAAALTATPRGIGVTF